MGLWDGVGCYNLHMCRTHWLKEVSLSQKKIGPSTLGPRPKTQTPQNGRPQPLPPPTMLQKTIFGRG